MKLYLVRHGESVVRKDNICQGQLDFDLYPKGFLQAQKIGKALRSYNINQIYSSNLKRGYNTALEIMNFFPHLPSVIKDIRLREKNHGEFQGKKYSNFEYNNLSGNLFIRKTNNGETLLEHKIRVLSFLNDLFISDTENPLIIVHGGVKRIILQDLLNHIYNDIYYKKTVMDYEKSLEKSNFYLYELDILKDGFVKLNIIDLEK